MRYALKFGYHGKVYSGYARQPGLKTVESEIINALKKTRMIDDLEDAQLRVASRTDSGVSACGNVLSLTTGFRKDEILGALNAHLDDIWFYGMTQVLEDFNPRHAKNRWYRYHLFNEDIDVSHIQETANIFVGTHDFLNFAKPSGDESTRTIDSIDVVGEKEGIVLDFKAQSFMWHMVRRIVKAILDVEEGKLARADIKKALDSREKIDYGLAPPWPLILMDVSYDFEFEIHSMKLGDVKISLEKDIQKLHMKNIIYDQMLKIAQS
ncbi:MAG: tRNA pseudouridine(38-40) synthase TruA [Methanomassiliicoccales archaeon]|nr:MAG: tRNA pseudouridine(38-40) synthase TruA [Methanomassiliicoccales archaeon]